MVCLKIKMDVSRDLFGSQGSDDISPTEFSGVSAAAAATVTPPVLVETNVAEKYQCPECLKVLKTQRGFLSHTMLHKLKNAYARKPTYEDLLPEITSLVIEVLEEMSKAPVYTEAGMAKQRFLNDLLTHTEDPDFIRFVEAAAEPLTEIAAERIKVVRTLQIEDCLKKLNAFLNDEEQMEYLQIRLGCVLPDSEISKSLLGQILYRFIDKLFSKLQCVVFSRMRSTSAEADSCVVVDLNEDEKTNFKNNFCVMLRNFYKRGHVFKDPNWQSFCSCLRKRFVWRAHDDEVSEKDFLNPLLWKEDSNADQKISLDGRAVKLCFYLEKLIRSAWQDKSNIHPLSADTAFDRLLSPQYEDALDIWYNLTAPCLAEAESLKFLRDIVTSIVNFMCSTEANRAKEILVQKGKQQRHALRDSLKRN